MIRRSIIVAVITVLFLTVAVFSAAILQLSKKNNSLKNELNIRRVSASEENVPTETAVPIKGNCYLTFDDGPSENTDRILEILREHNATATFFVIGGRYNDKLLKIKEAGHTIGLHTFCHNYSCIYSSTAAYFDDLKKISDTVESVTGVKSNIIRFPGGSSNTISRRYCKGVMTELVDLVTKYGYFYFDWNVSCCDAEGRNLTASQICGNVLNEAKGKNSVCVLMHDLSGCDATVEALPDIIEGLRNMGFTFAAITENTYGYHHCPLN